MKQLKTAIQDVQKYSASKNNINSLNAAIKDVYDACKKELDGACREILHDSHKIETDTPVIHYTSIDVLASMLNCLRENKNRKISLRAYDTIHMNDPYEGNFLTRFIPKELDWLKADKKNRTGHAYIASFILQGEPPNREDNLVFWRMYGREGQGCSLLIPVGEEESSYLPRSRLWKILYGEKNAKKAFPRICEKIQLIQHELQALNAPPTIEHYKLIQGEFKEIIWRALDKIRFLYKSDAYRYENECRFVLTEQECSRENQQEKKSKVIFDPQNRGDGSSRIRHYFEHESLDIRKLMVTGSRLTLGPLVLQQENVKNCLSNMMEETGLTGPKIKLSEIPYQRV